MLRYDNSVLLPINSTCNKLYSAVANPVRRLVVDKKRSEEHLRSSNEGIKKRGKNDKKKKKKPLPPQNGKQNKKQNKKTKARKDIPGRYYCNRH